MTQAIRGEELVDGGLTDEQFAQRLEALELANTVRVERAKLKRDLKAGRVQLAGVLQSPPEWLHTAKVIVLLLALPGYGRVRVAKVFASSGLAPTMRVGSLSAGQRAALARAVIRHAPRHRQRRRSGCGERRG